MRERTLALPLKNTNTTFLEDEVVATKPSAALQDSVAAYRTQKLAVEELRFLSQPTQQPQIQHFRDFVYREATTLSYIYIPCLGIKPDCYDVLHPDVEWLYTGYTGRLHKDTPTDDLDFGVQGSRQGLWRSQGSKYCRSLPSCNARCRCRCKPDRLWRHTSGHGYPSKDCFHVWKS